MIKIKKIHWAGGGCPYQLEATTEDGKFFYLRYRGGWLKAGTAESESMFDYSVESFNVIRKQIGEEYDGIADHDMFMSHLADKVEFPNGFRFRT